MEKQKDKIINITCIDTEEGSKEEKTKNMHYIFYYFLQEIKVE